MCPAQITISDSIAVCILDKNVIITGLGNELHLHGSKKSGKLKIQLKGKVHGIAKGNHINALKLLVYGEKEFVLLTWNEEYDFKVLFRSTLTDWISAATFLDESAEFVLLTAHSVLLRLSYEQNKDQLTICRIDERSSCEDKSTLYCAYLYGNKWKDLVVFGGNAFGELIIWQSETLSIETSENDKVKANVLQSIAAHNGVIFSIDYEPDTGLLITTSDDRSVRFWHVSNEINWKKKTLKPLASGYGHMARVFQGRIIQNGNYVVTVGEDSYLCIWRSTGELIFKQRHQFGAVIWNLAYDNDTDTLFSVGSTGNLLAYNINNILSNEYTRNLSTKLTSVNTADPTEYVAKVKFVTTSSLIGVTSQNRLVLYSMNSKIWKNIDTFSKYKCTVLEVFENFVAICGYKRMTMYEFQNGEMRQLIDTAILPGVIRSFHFLDTKRFLLSDDQGNCILQQGTSQFHFYMIKLPKCKERWLTAALSVTDKVFLVSNRLGNVMMYQFDDQQGTYIMKATLKHPNGRLGATTLKSLSVEKTSAYVQSAGHDGSLKVLCLDFEKGSLSISNRQNVPIAWVENIDQVDMVPLYLGFNDNHFVVWSEEHDTTVQVACGGGHRCWDYSIYKTDSDERHIKLVFIKNKNVLYYDLPVLPKTSTGIMLPYRNRWHVRPCNVMEVVENVTSKEIVTITAGDDNLIKVSVAKNNESTSFLEQKTEIHPHISNVRALKVINLTSSEECLIFSGGGRAQLCITKLNLKNYIVSEILNHTLKPVSNVKQTQQEHSFDPETRIMAIDVLNQHSCKYFVYVGCSDGFLRKYFVNEKFEIQLEKEYFYGKCLLQVRLVADIYFLAATTEGLVYIHDLELNTTYLKLSLHASGINGLDFKLNLKDEILHLLTGGDDQAVVYAKVCIKKLSEPNLIEKLDLPQLHTAQLTAVRFSKDGEYSISSGVDQNLVKYDLKKNQIVKTIHTCVADVKGICLSEKENCIFVYGCGLQVYDDFS